MAIKKTTTEEVVQNEEIKIEQEPVINVANQPSFFDEEYQKANAAYSDYKKQYYDNQKALLKKDMVLKEKTLAAIQSMIENNQNPSNEIQIKILETAAKLYHVIVGNNVDCFI